MIQQISPAEPHSSPGAPSHQQVASLGLKKTNVSILELYCPEEKGTNRDAAQDSDGLAVGQEAACPVLDPLGLATHVRMCWSHQRTRLDMKASSHRDIYVKLSQQHWVAVLRCIYLTLAVGRSTWMIFVSSLDSSPHTATPLACEFPAKALKK